MVSDGKRSYYVLTEEEVLAKMDSEINEISEIFSVKKSAATVILQRHGWSLFKVSDHLCDNKEKFIAESGLNSVTLNHHDENVSSACGICLESYSIDQTLATPFCSHKFCITCWGEYLKSCLDQDHNQTGFFCPSPDCHAAVGPDTIQCLPGEVKRMYWRNMLRSYCESKKEVMKLCPAPGCEYTIELLEPWDDDEDEYFSVICGCAYIFCWKCQLESHRPVTCNNASDWMRNDGSDNADESLSLNWIVTNTKPCPSCFRPIELADENNCKILICAPPCRFHFCWKCLRSVEAHRGEWQCSAASLPAEAPPEMYERRELAVSLNQNYFTCLELWDAAQNAMQKAISDLQNIENSKMYELCERFNKSEMGFVREAWMLIVQCRQVVKWSYVYYYFLSDYESAKRQYLQHLQEEANNTIQRFSENLQTEIKEAPRNETFEEFKSFKLKLKDMTNTTGNFIHNFVKTLEDGLPDVKVTSYDDFGGLYWFCDVCTYQNSWLEKQCKICYDGFATP